ncbi:MAG: hypothetical protein V1763_00805 [Parcubacteria group bacterium]
MAKHSINGHEYVIVVCPELCGDDTYFFGGASVMEIWRFVHQAGSTLANKLNMSFVREGGTNDLYWLLHKQRDEFSKFLYEVSNADHNSIHAQVICKCKC